MLFIQAIINTFTTQYPTLLFNLLNPLTAVGVIAVVAILLGLIIVLVSKVFAVEVDESQEEINNLLPGVNCGGCGYSGCSGYAEALASGADTDIAKCTAGGQDTVEALATYFGQTPGVFVPKVAVVHCQGSCENVRVTYEYTGSTNCQTASELFGGPGSCQYGCMGYGDCVRACEYGAINIESGLAEVNPDKCIACGACVKACPRNLISIQPKYHDLFSVRCSNPLPGKDVREVCSVGCIGCTLCVRNCPVEAIRMEDKLAVIDPEICVNCGKCASVCPTKAIVSGLKVPSNIFSRLAKHASASK